MSFTNPTELGSSDLCSNSSLPTILTKPYCNNILNIDQVSIYWNVIDVEQLRVFKDDHMAADKVIFM